jgi:7-carboxy-7-deazaguanine synthase
MQQPNLVSAPSNEDGLLPVSEVFYTIQGEGRWMGVPSVFVRLLYCNVGCSWCDTRYTWHSDELDEPVRLAPEALAKQCAELVPDSILIDGTVHLIVSGGEPLLHQDVLPTLFDAAHNVGFHYTEIETSATIMPSVEMIKRVNWWDCSPKLSNSRIDDSLRIRPDVLRAFVESERADFLFVVRNESDVEEIQSIYGELVPRDLIWLMPEGTTAEGQLKASHRVVDLCLKYGYRLGMRSHIFFWGNERGR